MKNVRQLLAIAFIAAIAMTLTGFQVNNSLWKRQFDTDSARQAYPFSLPNAEGRLVKASDFKGKLVVMEFWFTGCAPCIALAKSMESVIDHFKNNEDVVFVSINLDREKEKWLHSLANGVRFRHKDFDGHVDYVHPGAVSLSTYPYAFDHPIAKHYDIKGAPVLIIVGKEGEILDRNPPRPFFIKRETINEFIALIESHLADSESNKLTTP